MRILSLLLNAGICLTTLAILAAYFRKDGRWNFGRGRKAFRFFTVQSNALCAFSACFMAVGQIIVLCGLTGEVPFFIWLLKYLGTLTVAVTMATVFCFLGPTQGGYRQLLAHENLYMHLLGPLAAILSFCMAENRPMSVGLAMSGMIPVILYGTFYLYKIKYAPEEKRWEDFYGFNRGGKWPVSFGFMLAGTLILCLIFWGVSHL